MHGEGGEVVHVEGREVDTVITVQYYSVHVTAAWAVSGLKALHSWALLPSYVMIINRKELLSLQKGHIYYKGISAKWNQDIPLQ